MMSFDLQAQKFKRADEWHTFSESTGSDVIKVAKNFNGVMRDMYEVNLYAFTRSSVSYPASFYSRSIHLH